MNLQRVGRWLKSTTVNCSRAERAAERVRLLVRQLEEFVEQAELVHHLERRGMDRVAAKVAQEVGVLLQHHDVDAGARQQEAEHHAGRPAADDAAARVERRSHADQPLARHVAGEQRDAEQQHHDATAATSMPRSASAP